MSGHLRFGAKLAPRGRRPSDTGTAKTVVGTLQKWPAKAGGRSPKGPAVTGTTVTRIFRVEEIFILREIFLPRNKFPHEWNFAKFTSPRNLSPRENQILIAV